MPAWRLNNLSSTSYLGLFDVVGKDGQDGQDHFIVHAGLAANSGDRPVTNVPVIDMGPPLPSNQSMPASVVGNAALTVDEQQKIRLMQIGHVIFINH
jgi:hypothetical protein